MNLKQITPIVSILLGTVFVFYLSINSCKHEPMGIDQLDTVCFSSQILPILQTSCGISGCHDAYSHKSGFAATSYESIIRIVIPGNAANSKLYEVITNINSDEMMPPSKPLSKELRTLILVWIEQGANNTTCSTNSNNQYNMDTICFNQNIEPIIQSSCGITGCHDAVSHREGYILTNYNTLVQKSGSIVPYNPNSSKIYEVITTSSADDIMPPLPKSPLTTEQKELFRKWIAEGALNSDCPWTQCDTSGTILFSQQVWPLIQNSCLGCHNSSNTNGGINLDSYTNVNYYAETLRNGTPILTGALYHESGFFGMPPSGILSECQLRTFDLWISQGRQNN